MATVVNFAGKKIIEPGVYAQILSGIPAQPSNFSFGNVCIIDTGSGANYGGGSGINGVAANGQNSVYSFTDINDFQDFVRGGLLWDLAPYLFSPASGASGPEVVTIVRAAETTPAEIEFNFVGGGPNGGDIKFICKNEGKGGNGYVDEILAKGKIQFAGPVTIGDTISAINVDEAGPIVNLISAPIVTTTTSLSDLRALVVAAINSGTSGYTAYEQAGEVIVTVRRKTGATANTYVWDSFTIVGTVTLTGVDFTGGVDGTQLSVGYAALMREGDEDPAKFLIEFFEGTYRGISPGGNHYSNLTPQQSAPNLIAKSVEFDNIDTLIQWAKNDISLSKRFSLDPNWIINGTGVVDAADLVTYTDLNLAVNGDEDYASDDLDKVLKDIRELDNTFFLCDRWGAEATGTQNVKILNHIKNTAEFNKFMVVGGGSDQTKFDVGSDSSIEIAKYYDSASVIVVHSGFKRPNVIGTNIEKMPSIYHAANVLGRLGGLEPQVPVTFKNISATDFNHPLGITEREKALQYGVLHNRLVPGIGNVVNQGINTIQRNTQLINPDGTSFEISIMRIGAQLNKELVLNMRPLFVGNNIGTITPADVKAYVEGYLLKKTATDQQDNLIISFKNVTVRLIEDYYDIKYGFVPNGPINKLFVTGFMLDANLTA